MSAESLVTHGLGHGALAVATHGYLVEEVEQPSAAQVLLARAASSHSAAYLTRAEYLRLFGPVEDPPAADEQNVEDPATEKKRRRRKAAKTLAMLDAARKLMH